MDRRIGPGVEAQGREPGLDSGATVKPWKFFEQDRPTVEPGSRV